MPGGFSPTTYGALVGLVQDTLAGAGALIGPPGSPGHDGETPEFQMSGAILQMKYPSESVWSDLYTFTPGTETFVHNQATPAYNWNIFHSLGNIGVSAIVVDSSGDEIIGFIDRAASTANLLVIRFPVPLSGTAYIKS